MQLIKEQFLIFELNARIIGNEYENGLLELKKLERQKALN